MWRTINKRDFNNLYISVDLTDDKKKKWPVPTVMMELNKSY
jgi:hypothetical protein